MKIYTITRDGILDAVAHTSLKPCCEAAGLSYWSVFRKFDGSLTRKGITINRLIVSKIKGRGGLRPGK